MRKFILLFTSFIILSSPVLSSAHPGNTAADGCHYCRTNCSSWGVGWNVRHCHGGKKSFTTGKTITRQQSMDLIKKTRQEELDNKREEINEYKKNLGEGKTDSTLMTMISILLYKERSFLRDFPSRE